MTSALSVIEIARLFRFVREAGPNRGLRVTAIQRWCGGRPGELWCCYFATMVLDLFFQGRSPIPRLGACQDVLVLARKNGWLVSSPLAPGDLFLYVVGDVHTDQGFAHHVGIVTDVDTLTGIAGNTSQDGQSSNGTGVFEHPITADPRDVVYVHYPRA